MAGIVSNDEIDAAVDAGSRFKSAIRSIHYNPNTDEITFEIPWGKITLSRRDVPHLRDVSPHAMRDIYISSVGVHINELDLDINSAGLLEALFRELGQSLSVSF